MNFDSPIDVRLWVQRVAHTGQQRVDTVVEAIRRCDVIPGGLEEAPPPKTLRTISAALDDVCDLMDQAADELDLYKVSEVRPAAVQQAGVIHRATSKLAEAIAGLDGLRDVRDLLVGIHTLEDEGDRIVRDAVARLFSNGMDPLTVIQWKDIHQDLEQAVDGCERAAHVLESVYLKNR